MSRETETTNCDRCGEPILDGERQVWTFDDVPMGTTKTTVVQAATGHYHERCANV